MIKVLILASSPQDQGPLHLGREHKLIRHSLDSASNREQFRVISCMATTPDDLRRYLLEHTPTVVHFCGHGAGQGGLCFEGEDGGTQLVSGASLAKLFHLVNQDVQCVVLNACMTDDQARAISEHIDFVVGMRDSIGDDAALKFAQGFYEALWAGESFERAFKFGCSAIDTAGLAEDHIPVLLRSPRLGGISLAYSEDTQTIENFLLRWLNADAEGRARLTVEGVGLSEVLKKRTEGIIPLKWSSVSVIGLKRPIPGYCEVTVIARFGTDSISYIYYLKMGADDILLDWKATNGYWPIPFKTLLALCPPEPVTVRVIAELSDYHNFGYDFETYLSVKLEHLEEGHIHGYLPKQHDDFERALTLLGDGRSHRIIVDIILQQPGTRTAFITRLVAESWVLPMETPTVAAANNAY